MKSIALFILITAIVAACTPSIPPSPTLTAIPTSTVNLVVETLTPTQVEPTPTEEMVEPSSTPTAEPTPTEELITITINQENPYELIATIAQEELVSASDEKLLDTAPLFTQNQDFQEYGFDEGEVNELNPKGEVVKVGEQRFVPYIDQDGKMRMWWNVEKREFVIVFSRSDEHFSVYLGKAPPIGWWESMDPK